MHTLTSSKTGAILVVLALAGGGSALGTTFLDNGPAVEAADGHDDGQELPTSVLRASVSGLGSGERSFSYPAFAGDGTPAGTKDWKTYRVGGNCCEHYLATSPEGWIINLGSAHPTFTKDGGATWERARPNNPMLGAEGAVTAAPGGDIVGMTWDPYTGDQVVAYKYDADDDEWYYNLVNLKTAFFDRPWMSVAPGPFMVDGVEIPYVTFLRGGLAKIPQYMSLDGLHYTHIEHTYMAAVANVLPLPGVTITDALPDFGVDVDVDYYQPHQSALGSALPRGGYFAPLPNTQEKNTDLLRFAVLQQDLTWQAYESDLEPAEYFFDGDGGIHRLDLLGNAWLEHAYSADGGQTWTTHVYNRGVSGIEQWDFKVNAELGLAVVLINWGDGNVDQDIAYKVWDYASDIAPDEMLYVGAGNLNTGQGLLSSIPRFDFNTLGILPDGRIVAAFADSAHRPGFAIEADDPSAAVSALAP